MIDDALIERAAQMLVQAARKPAKVILFGSYARGDAGPDSDLDFLVIEPNGQRRFGEMVRLRAVLDPLRVPADVIVATPEHIEEWGRVRSTMLNTALNEGRVVAESRPS